jgi:hypothetical protein
MDLSFIKRNPTPNGQDTNISKKKRKRILLAAIGILSILLIIAGYTAFGPEPSKDTISKTKLSPTLTNGFNIPGNKTPTTIPILPTNAFTTTSTNGWKNYTNNEIGISLLYSPNLMGPNDQIFVADTGDIWLGPKINLQYLEGYNPINSCDATCSMTTKETLINYIPVTYAEVFYKTGSVTKDHYYMYVFRPDNGNNEYYVLTLQTITFPQGNRFRNWGSLTLTDQLKVFNTIAETVQIFPKSQ